MQTLNTFVLSFTSMIDSKINIPVLCIWFMTYSPKRKKKKKNVVSVFSFGHYYFQHVLGTWTIIDILELKKHSGLVFSLRHIISIIEILNKCESLYGTYMPEHVSGSPPKLHKCFLTFTVRISKLLKIQIPLWQLMLR